MPEQALQALIDRFEADFGHRLDHIEERFDKQDERLDHLSKRADEMHLNGDAPALRRLAKAAPALIIVSENADAIVAIVTARRDSGIFWTELKRRIHWEQWKWLGRAAIVAALGAAAFIFFHTPSPPNPPTPKPPVVTAPATPTPTVRATP